MTIQEVLKWYYEEMTKTKDKEKQELILELAEYRMKAALIDNFSKDLRDTRFSNVYK